MRQSIEPRLGVISYGRLEQLKRLFAEDGLELSDKTALEVGAWLLMSARSISRPISVDRLKVFKKLKVDHQVTV